MQDIRYAIAQPNNDRPVMVFCPAHRDTSRPNLAVYPDGTYCFGCGFRESAGEFLIRVGKEGVQLPDASVLRDRALDFDPGRFRSSIEIWHQTLVRGPRQHRVEWLLERGVRRDTINAQKIGHAGDAFSIPVWNTNRDRSKTLSGYKLRIDPEYEIPQPKYINARGQPNLLYRPAPYSSRIVGVCEGELDALVLSQYGVDALTTTNGAQSIYSKVCDAIPGNTTLFLFTDQDEAGTQVAAQFQAGWGGVVCRPHWDLRSGKDISDYLLTFNEGYRHSQVIRLIETASEL